MRNSGIALGLALALASCERTQGDSAAARARPNVLFVSIDSLRSDHLGCYGYPKPTSPRVDRLAAEGVRFESAISTTSWTLPAHAAMFTGLYDSTHGVVDNGLRLSEGHRTLAEVLQQAGYRTAGFFGGPYLHPAFGLGQGFDHYESCMSALPSGASDDQVRALSQADVNPSHTDVTGPRTVEAFTRWIDGADGAKPFFAFVHLWDVHYDYIPPPEYARMFDPDYAGTLDATDFAHNPAIEPKMSPRDLQHVIALYDGEIRFTDDVLGRMLDKLEALGRLENTLVVVTADHGEEFFEHGDKGHQRTLYDEVVRVPLVFRWPKQLERGRVVRDQVSLVDLYPTILTLAGVREQPLVQGRDLGPLLRGESMPAEPALCELYADKRGLSALRTNPLKVFRVRLKSGAHRAGGYDLVLDPGEKKDLTGDDARVKSGAVELEKKIGAALEFQEKIGHGVREIDIDAEMLRRLKAAGYMGEDEHDEDETKDEKK